MNFNNPPTFLLYVSIWEALIFEVEIFFVFSKALSILGRILIQMGAQMGPNIALNLASALGTIWVPFGSCFWSLEANLDS